MRLVVLDMNVIVSAGDQAGRLPRPDYSDCHSRGEHPNCRKPFHHCRVQAGFRILQIRAVYFPPEWLEFLIESALRFPDGASWPHPLPDPDDARFLSLVKTTGASLITANLKHYPAESRRGVIVRTPAEYVAELDETP